MQDDKNDKPTPPDGPEELKPNGDAAAEPSTSPERMAPVPKSTFDRYYETSRRPEPAPSLPFFPWEEPYPRYGFDAAEIERLAAQIESARIVWLYSPTREGYVAESLAWQALDHLSGRTGRRLKITADAGPASLHFLDDGLDQLYSKFSEAGETHYIGLSGTNSKLLQDAMLKSPEELSALRKMLSAADIVYVFWSERRIDPRLAANWGDAPVEFAVRTIRAILSDALRDKSIETVIGEIETRIDSGQFKEAGLVAEAMVYVPKGEEELVKWLEEVRRRQPGSESELFHKTYAPEIGKVLLLRDDKSRLHRVALYLAGCFDGISLEDFLRLGAVLLAGEQRIVPAGSAASRAGDPAVQERTEALSDVWSREIDDICSEALVCLSPVRLDMIVDPSDFVSYVASRHVGFHRNCLIKLAKAGLLQWKNEAVADRFVDLYLQLVRSSPQDYIPRILALVGGIALSRQTGGPQPSVDAAGSELLSDDRQMLERAAGLIQRVAELRVVPGIAAQCLRHLLKTANVSMFFQMVEVLSRRKVVRRLEWWNEYCARFPNAPVSDDELETVIDSLVNQAGSMAELVKLLADFEEQASKNDPAGALIEQVWLAAILAGTWWSIGAGEDSPPEGSFVRGIFALDDERMRKLAKKIARLDFGSGRIHVALKRDAKDIYVSAMALLAKVDDAGDGTGLQPIAFRELPQAELPAAAALAAILTTWTSIGAQDDRGDETNSDLRKLRTLIKMLLEELDPKRRHQLSRGAREVERWLNENLTVALGRRGRGAQRSAAQFGLKRTRARELCKAVEKWPDGSGLDREGP